MLLSLLLGCPPSSSNTTNFDGIILSITLADDSVCLGEQVEVTVVAEDPKDPAAPVQVYVNGWYGNPQHVQFTAPGDRRVSATAITQSGEVDQQSVELTVRGWDHEACRNHHYVQMFSTKNPYDAYTVDFWLEAHGEEQSPGFSGDIVWDFGNGESLEMPSSTVGSVLRPYASVDYSDQVVRIDEYTPFDVRVTGEIGDGETFEINRKLSVASGWWIARQMGYVPLEIVKTNPSPELPDGTVDVEFIVYNYYDHDVILDEYYLEFVHCDLSPPRWEAVSAHLVFGDSALPELGSEWPHNTNNAPPSNPGMLGMDPATSTQDGDERRVIPTEKPGKLEMDPEHVSPEVCSLGLHVVGQTADGLVARGSTYHKIRPNPYQRQTVGDATTAKALQQLVDDGLVPDDDVIRTEELYELEQHRVIDRTEDGWEVIP